MEAAVERSGRLPAQTARGLLRRNAEVVRRHLGTLSAWSEDATSPCPAHLVGLTAFDLADAAEALEAEAARRCA